MLRDYHPDDYHGFCDIVMHPSVNPFLSFEIMDSISFMNTFDELVNRNTVKVFEQDDKVVAVVIIKRHKRRCAHVVELGTLGVHPDYQSKGIGHHFIQAILDDLSQDESIRKVQLTVESDNEKALAFYEKLGFEQEGVFKEWFKRKADEHYVDEIFLAKFIR